MNIRASERLAMKRSLIGQQVHNQSVGDELIQNQTAMLATSPHAQHETGVFHDSLAVQGEEFRTARIASEVRKSEISSLQSPIQNTMNRQDDRCLRRNPPRSTRWRMFDLYREAMHEQAASSGDTLATTDQSRKELDSTLNRSMVGNTGQRKGLSGGSRWANGYVARIQSATILRHSLQFDTNAVAISAKLVNSPDPLIQSDEAIDRLAPVVNEDEEEIGSMPTVKGNGRSARKQATGMRGNVTDHSSQTTDKPVGMKLRRGKIVQVEEAAVVKQVAKRKTVRFRKAFTNPYKIEFGWSPFLSPRPYRNQSHRVFQILREHHANEITLEKYAEKKEPKPDDNSSRPMHAGQNVTFDAIVRTILSQATNNGNAQTVEQTLIHRFRYNFLGIKIKGKSPNYHAIREASEEELARALASGGLQRLKAKSIKGCLDVVHRKNVDLLSTEERIKAEEATESSDFEPKLLSLEYMSSMNLQEKFDHLVSMPGIGVKTAACILAFNFEYPLFAVDTHAMRLSRMLKWLPLNASSEDHAFMHLNKRIPDELKYGLHQAFWHHGQCCVRCQAGTTEKSKGWKETECPLESLVDRARKDLPKSKRKLAAIKEENGEEGETQGLDAASRPKRTKTRPHVVAHSKLTPERAAQLGYELRAVMIDDAFGVRRANRTTTPLLKWVRNADHDNIIDPKHGTFVQELAGGEMSGARREVISKDEKQPPHEAPNVSAQAEDTRSSSQVSRSEQTETAPKNIQIVIPREIGWKVADGDPKKRL